MRATPTRTPRLRPAASMASLAVAAAVGGCDGNVLAPGVFPDGAYVLQLQDPIVTNPLATPTWMGTQPTIRLSKSADALVVTSSVGDLVVAGPAARFERQDSAWVAHFEWRESPRHHYWSVTFTSTRCYSAEAVDADLGIGPGGVWTVPYARCVIVPD